MKLRGFDSTERVGIGSASISIPSHLHVTGGSAYKGIYVESAVDTLAALQVEADALTTGYAGYFYSNSATTNTRSLLYIRNDNTLATGTTALKISQDSTGPALVALGNVGIGTTDPGTNKLYVNGTAYVNTSLVVGAVLDASTSGVDVGVDLEVAGDTILAGDLDMSGGGDFYDKNWDAGTAGQVLHSAGDGEGVYWGTDDSGSGGDTVSIHSSADDILSVSSGEISAEDAGVDRLVFWDDSAGKLKYLTFSDLTSLP